MVGERNERPPAHVVMVTGRSGAGRTTAIRALEDVGFEAIDNLPLSLLERLLEGAGPENPLAVGVDARTRDFAVHALLDILDSHDATSAVPVELLYLDASDDVLLRRFSETRRRHPLAPDESPQQGIMREFDLLTPVRLRADILIDTSEMSVHDLRREVEEWFAPGGKRQLSVTVQSFSYKRGLPRGADLVFDCRFLRNPYWEPSLRALDGRDADVQGYIAGDARAEPFFEKVADLTRMLLPAYTEEGKAHLSVAFGCTGGQHRSVTMAERLAKALAQEGWQVSTRHRELDRKATG